MLSSCFSLPSSSFSFVQDSADSFFSLLFAQGILEGHHLLPGSMQRSARSILSLSSLPSSSSLGSTSLSSLRRVFPLPSPALSHLLLTRANLQPLGRTLDVAHATGDSLLLLKSPTSPFPRQSHLVGITSLPQHAQRAAVRLAAVYPKKGESIEILCEDAVYRGPKSSGFKKHPLDPTPREGGGGGKEEKFDSVVCLDAAYHFKSRERWLEQVLKDGLKEGGTVAFTDILASEEEQEGGAEANEGFKSINSSTTSASSPSPAPSGLSLFLLHYILLPLLSVPSSNIIPLSSLGASMVKLGYEDIEIDDITEDVFPGFASFLSGRDELSWRMMGKLVRWWSGGGRGLLRFVVVKASKPVGSRKKD